MPVAWNTSGSYSVLSASTSWVTSGVVTPNIVRPIAGRSDALAGTGLRTIPAIALAALPRTWREIRFRPATSVTEYIIAMSAGPTYGATLPDATVETITFGRPTGSARIPGVMIAVPPDPPMPMMPPIDGRIGADERLERHRHRTDRFAAIRRDDGCSAVRVMAGNLAGLHVGTRLVFGRADVDQHRDHPGRLDDVAHIRQLFTLRVERADDVDRFHPEIRPGPSTQRASDIVSSCMPDGRSPAPEFPARPTPRSATRTSMPQPGRCGG